VRAAASRPGANGRPRKGQGAEDKGEHRLEFVQGLVEGHPGARAFGSVPIIVQKPGARAARVTWRGQPAQERPPDVVQAQAGF